MILDSPIISGSSTVTGNLAVLGTLTANVSGSVTSASYATNAETLDGLDSTSFTTTSSFTAYTASTNASILSNAQNIAILYVSSSLLDSRVTRTEATASSLTTASSSFSTRVSASEASISNLTTASGSFSTRVTNAESSITSLNSRSGSFATTGSNTFIGNQTITGSLFITQDLIVQGSSSINYVSQSTLNIGTNLITVNAQNPSIRFGGLAVIDSGSAPQVSGSWLFDSIQNRWIMIHQQTSGGALTSSIAIMGPETYNNLGSETQLTQNRLVKGVAGASGEHIGDSNISDTGTVVSINSATQVTGSLGVTGITTFRSTGGSGLRVYGAAGTNQWDMYLNGANLRFSDNTGTGTFVVDRAATFSGFVGINGSPATNFPLEAYIDSSTAYTTSSRGNVMRVYNSNTGANVYAGIELGGAGPSNDGLAGINGVVTAAGSGALTFYTRNSNTFAEKMRLDASGNLMVGSTDAGNAGTINVSVGVAGTTAGGLQLWAASNQTHYVQFGDGTTGAQPYTGYVAYAHSTDSLLFGTATSTKMTLDASGDLGIGITSPTSLLHVNSGTTATQTIANFAAANYGSPSSRTYIQIGTQYGDGSSRIGSINTTGNQSALVFQTQAATSGVWNDAMYISGGGEVGIGTTSPAYKLDVSGTTRINGGDGLLVRASTGETANFFVSPSTGATYIDYAGFMAFRGSSEFMRITSGGHLLLGTTTDLSFISAWDNGVTRIGRGGLLFSYANNDESLMVSQNYYVNTAGNDVRVNAAGVSNIFMNAGSMYFRTAGSSTAGSTISWNNPLTLTSGGNVGIGTTSPNALLQVLGSSIIGSGTISNGTAFGGGGQINRLKVESGGYTCLEINGSTAGGSLQFTYGANAPNQVAALIGYNYANGSVNEFYIGNSLVGALTFGTNNTERMRITSGGNVGIGTTSPDAIFHVARANAGSVGGQIVIDNPGASTVGNTSEISFLTDAGASGAGTRNARILAVNENASNGAARLELHTWNGSTSAARMTILSGGDVGIGTTGPSERLEINGSIRLNDGNADGPQLKLASSGYSDWNIDNFSGNLRAYYGSSEIMRITSGGKVGINNTSPNNVVDIYDQTYFSNTVGVLSARSRGGGQFITGRVVTAEVSNQTQTIATFSAPNPTNERIFVKIQVVNTSAVSDYGNVHVGYALWSKTGTKSVTTMTLDSGNSNIGNSNVGTLSWSGDNLQYTTNRLGNYELNAITIWGSARDSGTIS